MLLDGLLYIMDWVRCSHKWFHGLWHLIRVGHHERQSFPLRDFHLLLIGHHWLWDRIVGGLVEGLCHRERRDDNIKVAKDGLQLLLCNICGQFECLEPIPIWEHLQEKVDLNLSLLLRIDHLLHLHPVCLRPILHPHKMSSPYLGPKRICHLRHDALVDQSHLELKLWVQFISQADFTSTALIRALYLSSPSFSLTSVS